MIAVLGVGLALTAVMTAVLVAGFGRGALLAAVVFGLMGTAIQVTSAALVQPAARGEFTRLIRRWGIGMGLRLAGIVAFGLASWRIPAQFPPLPTALAYLGVVVPLLFLEIRFLR
jgi:hypothetical protein